MFNTDAARGKAEVKRAEARQEEKDVLKPLQDELKRLQEADAGLMGKTSSALQDSVKRLTDSFFKRASGEKAKRGQGATIYDEQLAKKKKILSDHEAELAMQAHNEAGGSSWIGRIWKQKLHGGVKVSKNVAEELKNMEN